MEMKMILLMMIWIFEMFAIILGFAINKHNPFYSFALGAVSVSTGIK